MYKPDRLLITKDNLKALINNLKADCDEFIAPKREHQDDIIFSDVKHSGGEILDYLGNSVISPRSFLLPQTEILFKINSARGSDLSEIPDNKTRIFYGVRPCDIIALNITREFFSSDFVDEPYMQKIERSAFIALACSEQCCENSFCAQMDAGPVSKGSYDLQLIPITKGFLVEVGSKKGAQIIKSHKKLFTKAASRDGLEISAIIKKFSKKAKKADHRKLAKIMKQDKIPASAWDDIGLRCVVCSGCITLCPTCTCFSITDRISADKGQRIRYCDGCPYAGFTRMAAGNTPIREHKDHIRRFFEHKLNIDAGRYGRPSCVGCARCVDTCPGNISIKKFIEDALKVNDK